VALTAKELHVNTINDPASAGTTISGTNDRFVLEIAAAILEIPVPLQSEGARQLLRLNRKQAAEFLTRIGYGTTPSRLAKMASIGNGPCYRTWGRSVLYDPIEILAWAQGRERNARASVLNGAAQLDKPVPVR
jgi:hypothetical protein